jgi:hypothetical protein
MKRRPCILGNILLICSLLLLLSCKKDDTPDYPELIGYWQGLTSQGNPVSLKIENKKGTLYVTKYNLLVTFSSSQSITYERTNAQGIVALSGLYFHLPLGTGNSGAAFIDGTFNYGSTTITLTGNFSVYYPSSTVDVVTGNYTAYKY